MSEHELWNELGNLYFTSGAYNQAANAYRRSIELNTGFGRPYSNLALAYVEQGKYVEAIELYRTSIELLQDNKEKAISWNRLGSVYRHLKDYSQAVIAFQEADELDPGSVDEFPPSAEARSEADLAPSSVLDEPVSAPVEATAEVAWWDVDEEAATVSPDAEQSPPASTDEHTASWAPADLELYQEDISQLPETGSLTTWGDAELEGRFGIFSPLDPEPEVHIPGPEDDDIATWLPVPEDEPLTVDEVPVSPVEQPVEPDPEFDVTEQELPSYHVIQSMDFAPLLPAKAQSVEPVPAWLQSSQATRMQVEVDVDVEERPAPEFSRPAQPLAPAVSAAPAPTVESVPAAAPVAAQPLERDPDEMREIETGIAKFKRVVQLNPRNAHAWDTLGTLYKSAGRYKDAILAYQEAISNDSSRSLYFHHLGLVYACEGRDEDAIGAFQRVIELDPEYSLAHATLGGYYRKMGLEELAQKHIGIAMKSIFDSENEYNRACMEAICGNAEQAIELLGVALKNKQTYVDWILRDPDLDFIRQDPRFKQLISDFTR